MKLQTPVTFPDSKVRISTKDSIMVLGSCFADGVGERMMRSGLDVCVNPFGTLYNPVSILSALQRLEDRRFFSEEDCVKLGAGSDLVCSFSHHTSFARPTAAEFLENANARLDEASSAWRRCTKLIISLGTIYCFRNFASGDVVSNCLKRNAAEFERQPLPLDDVRKMLERIIGLAGDREVILTVSPIRHLADGAHGNQLSKSSLLLAADAVKSSKVEYFPAYEIVMDELRDYRFYSEDMVHPSSQAVDYIWQRFIEFAVDDKETVAQNERAFRSSQHRPLH